MEKVELEAKQREKTGTTASRNIRLSGQIPAIVYGKGIESLPVLIDSKKFIKIISSKAGRNVLINLKVGGDTKSQEYQVITHEVLRNPINDKIIHVDFHRISMEQEIKTKVPVILVGESVGVKMDGGILVHGLRELEIKCLATKIPEKFEVDISQLKIGNSLHVSDMKIGAGITILTLPSESVVTIAAPTKEEEVAAPIVAPEVTGQTFPGAPGAEAPAAPAGAKEAAPAKAAAPAKGAAPTAKGAAPAAKEAPAPEAKKK